MTYRIVRNTHVDGTDSFTIQKQSVYDYNRWNDIAVRDTIEEARHVVEQIMGREIVKSEVVE